MALHFRAAGVAAQNAADDRTSPRPRRSPAAADRGDDRTARPLRASEAPCDLLTGREPVWTPSTQPTSPPASSRRLVFSAAE
jgi:hypothetical protein